MEERMWVVLRWQALQVEALPSEGSRQRWRWRWRQGVGDYGRWGEVCHRVFNELKGEFGFYVECERKSAEDANCITLTEISVKCHWSKEKNLSPEALSLGRMTGLPEGSFLNLVFPCTAFQEKVLRTEVSVWIVP